MTLRPSDFDYELPRERIALHPAAERAEARMLVVGREPGRLVHARVGELARHLPADALVVVNDSRVVPARIRLVRADGRAFELLLVDPRPDLAVGAELRAWVRQARRLRVGDVLVGGGVALELVGDDRDDPRARRFVLARGRLDAALAAIGETPLPPYIERAPGPDDATRYQTVFARHDGSVAAPTAGLHLDQALVEALDPVGVTLHVGPGTFLPMEVDDVADHRVGRERVSITPAAAARIERARADRRPIVAVGTTVVRVLEHVAAERGAVTAYEGDTRLVIIPGHRFAVVDGLLTNFHLPRSSLLMLVSSFAGHETTLAAYREAVAAGYRFYSYGDCMLVART